VPYTLLFQDAAGNFLTISNTCATAASCSGFTVTGTVFYDVNEDGIYQMPDDEFLPGFGVGIFADDNGDGIHQASETNLIEMVFTNLSGVYIVDNLTNGSYVAVVLVNPTTYSIINGQEPILINNSNYNVSAGLTTNFITLSQNITFFNAKDYCNYTMLNWQIANENDVLHYVIEQSINGVTFEQIGTIPAKNKASQTTSYSFDYVPNNTSNLYYRVVSIGNNGSKTTSKIIGIERDCMTNITINEIYPNPFENEINIDVISNEATKIVIVMRDVEGRIVAQKEVNVEVGNTKVVMESNKIANGMYNITILDENNISLKNHKIIKQ
jgi:hypothetical protein